MLTEIPGGGLPVLLAALVLAVPGCGEVGPTEPEPPSVTITPVDLGGIGLGSSVTLTAYVERADRVRNLAIFWSSTADSAISVRRTGERTAEVTGRLEGGEATIVARLTGTNIRPQADSLRLAVVTPLGSGSEPGGPGRGASVPVPRSGRAP